MNNDGFTKLFSTILTSSIWSEDDKTRILWITLLALADADGVVQAAIPGLAAMARMSLEDAERCIIKLESPDKYSRSEEFDGKRIEKIDGGWVILNYGKYRDRAKAEEKREYFRDYMRNKREKENVKQMLNAVKEPLNIPSASVSDTNKDLNTLRGDVGGGDENKGQETKKLVKGLGEMGTVKLTGEEYDKLKEKRGEPDLRMGIEILDTYIASTGKRYKSHYAVLKDNSWVWERVEDQKRKAGNNGTTSTNNWKHQDQNFTPPEKLLV